MHYDASDAVKCMRITDQYLRECVPQARNQTLPTELARQLHTYVHQNNYLPEDTQFHQQGRKCEHEFVLVITASIIHLDEQHWW